MRIAARLVMLFAASAASAQTLGLLDVVSAQSAPPTVATTPVSLRVLSFNLTAGKGPEAWDDIDPCGVTGPDGTNFLKPVAELILEQRCDIVCLQEVLQQTRCLEGGSQSAYLAQETGYCRKYATAVVSQSNVILSRWPIADTREIEMDARGAAQRRVALLARILVPGQPHGVWVCCTHLDQQRDSDPRLAQLAVLEPRLEALEGPLILAGDMNAEPESQAIKRIFDLRIDRRRLRDSFAAAGRGDPGTSKRGDHKFDWIFATPQLKPVDSVVLNPGLSDHRALRADFVLPRL